MTVGRKPLAFDLAEVERCAALGLTKEQIALTLGIGYSTLFQKERENPEFKAAIKRGQAAGIKAVTNALYENAMGGNTTAQIFFLKNRAPEDWKDRTEQSVTSKTKVEHRGKVNIIGVDDAG